MTDNVQLVENGNRRHSGEPVGARPRLIMRTPWDDHDGRRLWRESMERTSRDIYDELLVTRCQRRELSAWDELVERWNDRLSYYVRRLMDDDHESVSVLQDVWLHAIRGINRLRDGSRFAPWIYTIARRTVMTRFRKDYARREYVDEDAVTHESIEDAVQSLRLEDVEFVHYGLSRLEVHAREILTLFFLEDLSVREIAELIGIPEGTVKSRLFKARRELHRILLEEADPR